MELLSVKILTDGSELKDEYLLISAEVERGVSSTARATFSILLPNESGSNASFAISSGKDFLPGVSVEIKAGYNAVTETIFRGRIVGHGLQVQPDRQPVLSVRCQAAASKLTVGKKTATFEGKTDSAVIDDLLAGASLKRTVEATTYTHPLLIQHRMTDWDFIVSRAAANGMIVYSELGEVFLKAPGTSTPPKLVVTYGEDVLEFDGEVNASHQFSAASAAGWDFSTGKLVEAEGEEPSLVNPGNLEGSELAAETDLGKQQFRTTLPLPESSLRATANAMLLRSRMSAVRGRVVFYGNATPKINTLIELAGFGDRFNGRALITGVRHTIIEGHWTTETSFGLPPDWNAAQAANPRYSPEEASQISGLQNGVVLNIHQDPEGHARIHVNIPALDTAVWARQSMLFATQGAGAFFLPDIGDEVLLGFLADDPRFAVVLGSLPGPGHKSAYSAEETNKIKALTTRSGLHLEFNDDERTFSIATPAGNSLVLSEDKSSVVLTDENGNTVKLDNDGITLTSTKDIVLKASGKISLKADQNIEATSSGGDISLEGSIGIQVKGGASAELSSGGNTIIEGAMVMIN
ncbi:type VI secretion system tip protein VgrG [Neolewinella aurantiaca]|nr:type VI secretion system tip protein VgrG [Neolewinella aurantiaca]